MNRLIKNPDDLSELEIKVLIGTCQGLSSTEIAPLVSKKPRTVEKYRNDLYEKFYVANKDELVTIARKLFKLTS